MINLTMLQKIFGWLKSTWLIGNNLIKIIENQAEINQRLDKINKTIESPQFQIAELEKFQRTIDLLKENSEQEVKKLKMGSEEEIQKHKAEISKLNMDINAMSEYKELVKKAIGVLNQQDSYIEQLNSELAMLKKKMPSLSFYDLLGQQFGFVPTTLGQKIGQKIKNE